MRISGSSILLSLLASSYHDSATAFQVLPASSLRIISSEKRMNFNSRLDASSSPIDNSSTSTSTTATTASSSKPGKSKVVAIPSSDCDDTNIPPSLRTILNSIITIKSGSDIRGTFTDHKRMGSILNVSHAIGDVGEKAFTPLAAFCYGHAFARMVQIRCGRGSATFSYSTGGVSNKGKDSKYDFLWGGEEGMLVEEQQTVIAVGRDPRIHGVRIADALCRGIESVDGVKAVYTGLASTPAMFEFCRADKCDGSVMVTASHQPEDKNGMKFFTKNGGFSNEDIDILAEGATSCAKEWHDIGLIPPSSGEGAVLCSSWVDFMPHYASTLRNALIREVSRGIPKALLSENKSLPLAGLRIVLNPGNGSGCFFNAILHDLGADVSNSLNLVPDGTFPKDAGVPNPEYEAMIQATTKACEECNADIGIMLDTDADRCGFVIPKSSDENGVFQYEALNRNRLIALLGVIFQSSSPGCTVVTDSVTSEGLSKFLEEDLGLKHVRYVKGYANVIRKARELTESGRALAELAIETSGHCAMRENGYLDDGTYTAVKVIGLGARIARSRGKDGEGHMSLLELISEMEEMDEVKEIRLNVIDGTMATTNGVFRSILKEVEEATMNNGNWDLDKENLEGIRVRNGRDGGFFMIRKSLHDPVISLQVEGSSTEDIRDTVTLPLLSLFDSQEDGIVDSLDISNLRNY